MAEDKTRIEDEDREFEESIFSGGKEKFFKYFN